MPADFTVPIVDRMSMVFRAKTWPRLFFIILSNSGAEYESRNNAFTSLAATPRHSFASSLLLQGSPRSVLLAFPGNCGLEMRGRMQHLLGLAQGDWKGDQCPGFFLLRTIDLWAGVVFKIQRMEDVLNILVYHERIFPVGATQAELWFAEATHVSRRLYTQRMTQSFILSA